jgi:hypothetical protein
MRGFESKKYFKCKENSWSSLIDGSPSRYQEDFHKFRFKGNTVYYNGYTLFDEYGVNLGDNLINNGDCSLMSRGDKFQLLSILQDSDCVNNYLGYCKKKNYYATFERRQIILL